MVISILISLFFSVNDSILVFQKPSIKVLSSSDSLITLLYKGEIKEYEKGTYFYPKFIIREITVRQRHHNVVIDIKLRKKRSFIVKRNTIIFTHPPVRFFLKLSHADTSTIRSLLGRVNLKFNWLDSLVERYYTIHGVYTEKTLKTELLKHGRKKKNHKVKKR